EHLARPGLGIGRVLVAENLRTAVLVDAHGLHAGTISHMQASELRSLADEVGLDVVGAAPASAYDETERHIRERKARGLFADMRFTMAQPEISCHPETLLPGARTVVSAAYCYYAPEPPLEPGDGRLPRYTWSDAYCGTCTLCIDACPTGALDEPGVLDSTKCLSYWTQAARPIPEDYRADLGAHVYGCDICQDVCPWNRGVEKRRADAPLPAEAEPHVRLADWLREDGDALRRRYDRLY